MTTFDEVLLLTRREILASAIRRAKAGDRSTLCDLEDEQRELTKKILGRNA